MRWKDNDVIFRAQTKPDFYLPLPTNQDRPNLPDFAVERSLLELWKLMRCDLGREDGTSTPRGSRLPSLGFQSGLNHLEMVFASTHGPFLTALRADPNLWSHVVASGSPPPLRPNCLGTHLPSSSGSHSSTTAPSWFGLPLPSGRLCCRVLLQSSALARVASQDLCCLN